MFCDMCGGGAKVSGNIDQYRFKQILYNDYELGMANMIACLADTVKTDKVIQIIDKMIQYSDQRGLFCSVNAVRNDPELDMLLSAAYTIYAIYASYRTNRMCFSQGAFNRQFVNHKIHLKLNQYNPIFKDFIVTSTDCFELIKQFNENRSYLCFLDVPYVGSEVFLNNWSHGKHRVLVDLLLQTQMRVILCGYDNDIYSELMQNGWNKTFMGNISVSYAASANITRRANEYIWTNFIVPDHLQYNGLNRANISVHSGIKK